nr:hypothetical protein [Tanacetum cinerariifolium]
MIVRNRWRRRSGGIRRRWKEVLIVSVVEATVVVVIGTGIDRSLAEPRRAFKEGDGLTYRKSIFDDDL